ncbi:hypothetical protein SSP531S_31870 [Streptomyces spongiicola]|uniref:Cellulose synthase n=1 Tax=Streptomyces spongiicola TaxID=1690221 RepID=A0A2S1YUM3_9ACTN|nr:hypothetical protein [Streptomyces spongiicola]AWK07766.1 hypothetical protein DDQ41_01215 [Streptomyces spongiicola]GBQ01744.1 hypothetical protein SSP531S_31870 [Streptomyces spongiicola]
MLAETICAAVSAAGLGVAAVAAYRKRFLTATRIAAYALVPLGLVLTGVVEWAAGTVFSPTAWVGVGLLGAAWGLFLTTRAVERRRLARASAREGSGPHAVAPPASAPALGRAARPVAGPGGAAKPKGRRSAAGADDDFSDIEAILKKHGI